MTRTARPDRERRRPRRARILATALALLAPLVLVPPASAQEGGEEEGPPSADEVVEKVKEIERLMRSAEESLARSTRARRSREDGERAAREIEKLIDQRARAETGKSADDLRKEAQEGSAEAKQKIEEFTREATRKIEEMMRQAAEGAGGAAEGVRKLLEETSQQGRQAKEGIEWILERAVSHGGGGGGGGHQQQPRPEDQKPQGEQPKDPQGGQDSESQKDDPDARRPESDTQPPRDEEFEKWLATLPAQVRKAYESEDWDAVPVQYRALLRAWTKKMADQLEKETR